MFLPPAVIVHGLGDARRALAAGRAVTLVSAPGAASFSGCLWWARLLEAAAFDGPALLDCGPASGRALEALRLGLRGIVLSCPQPAFAVVAELAAAQNATLLAAAPAALDLGEAGAARRLAAWLSRAKTSEI